MFSSRLGLSVPRFLWRGRWFWGAWLLIFLLPLTRDEARLHFLGSRFFSDLYGQPWQEKWQVDEDAPTPRLSPLERAVWSRVRGQGFSSYSTSDDPASTAAGHIYHDFPREGWLHALALDRSLGWGPLTGRSGLGRWARQGEKLDPQNALYPIVLAKILGDSGRFAEREAALERAARCTRYDDGTSVLQAIALRAAQGAGVQTWSEKWRVWSQISNDWYMNSNQLDQLLTQFVAISQGEVAALGKSKNPTTRNRLARSALKRSNALMRVALLFQQAPCDDVKWKIGAQWARSAWRIARPLATYSSPPEPTVAEFSTFARAQKSDPDVRLAQKCAARMRLLTPYYRADAGLVSNTFLSTPEAVLAESGGPIGFSVLGFGFYLLCWWWFIALMGWRAMGQESGRRDRIVPAVVIITGTVLILGLLTAMMTLPRRGAPTGQLEVMAALGMFAFFAPPLCLALWCGVRAVRRHREALALPARAQLEMNLAPMDAFMLGRATGVFVVASIALAIGLSLLWGFLRWQGLTGYDWLRLGWPSLSTRVIDPMFTSLESPVTPSYCALGLVAISLIWLVSWRYGTDAERRPIFHDGLRAWKEAIGCAVVLTVWVYMALLVACHVGGIVFSNRLNVVAQRGAGAFVRGF